jgi:hypothetical protein
VSASVPSFEKKIRKLATGCWYFGRRAAAETYRIFRLSDGSRMPAHRFAWLAYKGRIPTNLWVLHTCDNPPCVNPDHLFVGTHQDNMRDMKDKGRARGRHGSRGDARDDLNDFFRRSKRRGRGIWDLPSGQAFVELNHVPVMDWLMRDLERIAKPKNRSPAAVLVAIAAHALMRGVVTPEEERMRRRRARAASR